MRYDVPIRLLVRVWLAGGAMPTEVLTLASRISGEPMLLRAASQITMGVPLAYSRTQLHTEDGRWTLSLPGTLGLLGPDPSLEAQRGFLPDDTYDFEATLKGLRDPVVGIVKAYGSPVRRIAVVQEGLLEELSPETLDACADKLLKRPSIFEAADPFEWDWRCAAKITRTFGESEYPTHTLITVKRVSGAFVATQQKFDRIRVDLDVNTAPGGEDIEFPADDVGAFLDSSLGWHAAMATSIREQLGIDNG